MSTATSDLELFRAEIARILASPEFASSRQLQDFLRYTSEKAFEGVTHLEQAEIAAAVLGRGTDFNPVEDATVRKMASQVRQRLDQHYARRDPAGEYVVVLPVRSYVPRLERRDEGAPAPVETLAPPDIAPAHTPARRRLIWIGTLAAVVLIGGFFLVRFLAPRAAPASSSAPIVLSTIKGDIIQGGSLAPPAGVQLGPALREVDEVTARLDFIPSMEAQQAGLIVWQDPEHFIRLGRKFFGRNQIEFLVQQGKTAIAAPANTVYDGDGQSGRPLWLSIHRDGNEYRAFLSSDGIHWEPHGQPIVPAEALKSPRAGIFALNGRRDAPSIPASFSHLSTGATFTAVGAPLDAYARSGWTTVRTCEQSLTTGIGALTLRIAFAPNPGKCNFEIYRPLAGRDWELTTRMDYLPLPGRSAGLHVAGTKASIRLARYSLNGPAIAFIHDGKTLIGRPDFNGSPTIYLRLRAAGGAVSAGFSADGERFQELPVNFTVAELGGDLRGGLRFSTSTTDPEEPSSTARFYWYREGILSLAPYR